MSDIPPPPPRPRDEKTVRNIEVLCQYIAKNGDGFDEMTCQKEVGKSKFEFLFGGPPGSEAAISHEYYKWMKRKCRSSEGADNRDASLKPLGISSSMQHDGTLHAAGNSHSPAGSDMDMEDDITQPEEPGIGKPSESATVDMTAEENAIDGNAFCSEPAGVIEQDPRRLLLNSDLISALEFAAHFRLAIKLSATCWCLTNDKGPQAVAICESPYMLIIGWKRLLEDLIGREGPFFETVCVPFAGLAILLWPLAVGCAVIAATISSQGRN